MDLGSIESMTLPLGKEGAGELTRAEADEVLEFVADKQVLAVGPGLGTADSTVELIRRIVLQAAVPLILDADGVNAFGGDLDSLAERQGDLVLTPHPGELARLLGTTSAEIQSDRLASARDAARRSGAVVVLKGWQTLVAEPRGTVFVNPTGNPGMATGGTGDVLTGILAGLVSLGLSCTQAACLAVYVHGRAGDLAADQRGETSLAAADLLASLPRVLQELEP